MVSGYWWRVLSTLVERSAICNLIIAASVERMSKVMATPNIFLTKRGISVKLTIVLRGIGVTSFDL